MPDAALAPYLKADAVIDWNAPAVAAQAAALAAGVSSPLAVARAAFLFVRDTIRHSADFRQNPVTCAASEVLRHGTGYCYAKAHLLVALLRANGIPAGLCYQRLTLDPATDLTRFCLHGLAAVHLPEHGWYRIDPRGNKPGVDARFTPPVERLAFAIVHPGEADLPGIHAAPLPVVMAALRRHATWDALLADLPDLAAQAD
ncbi:transglutaminase-like domain-containing protein [Solidesulfovibrio alcoholivorans]|uniref:transglutaminase-like domain-containing protein n=1 Tax=Solidesulfovibrio alcoholivorans TaxID=81406 RepID=UPI00049650B7|nr:transglutaminase family protein [Solidesulfovibrio alcoholivorans]